MRIGLISFHTFSQPGGVKRHILDLSKNLRKRGHQTKIIVPRRKRSENYGKDVILLGTSFPLDFTGSKSDFSVNFNPISLERTLKRERFDVLHFHNFGVPSIVQILVSPSASNALNVLTFHANVKGSEFLENFPSLLYLLNKVCQWKIDGIIGVASLILSYFKRYKGPKIVVPNGIDLEEFNLSIPKIKKYCDGKINLLFVGRIEKRKGLIYLLKAFKVLNKKFSNLRLIIVGDGSLKDGCKSYVKKNNLKEVVFEGGVAGTIAPYYRTADIFVSPAIFGESFGLVLLEAMACGLPVIATDVGGVHEILEPKFLIPTKNAEVLAEKISSLWKEPDQLKRVSKRNFEKAKEFSLSRTQMLRRAWFRWMKECGDRPEEKRWSEFAKDKLSKDLTN